MWAFALVSLRRFFLSLFFLLFSFFWLVRDGETSHRVRAFALSLHSTNGSCVYRRPPKLWCVVASIWNTRSCCVCDLRSAHQIKMHEQLLHSYRYGRSQASLPNTQWQWVVAGKEIDFNNEKWIRKTKGAEGGSEKWQQRENFFGPHTKSTSVFFRPFFFLFFMI